MITPGAASDELNARMRASYELTAQAMDAKLRAAHKRDAAEAMRIRLVQDRKHGVLVNQALRALLNDDVYERCSFDAGVDHTTNIQREVLSKVLLEFSTELSVTMDGPVPDEDVPGFNGFADAIDLHALGNLLKAPHYLYSRVCVMPRLSAGRRKRCLGWDVLTPESFYTVGTDDDVMALVVVDECAGDRGKALVRHTVWTDEEVTVLHESWGGRMLEFSRGPNPYGVIPGRVICGLGEGVSLADLAVHESAALTWQRVSGMTQIKLLGGEFGKDFVAGQAGGPGGLIQFGSGENFTIHDFQTNEEGWTKVHVDAPRRRACISAGLPPDDLEGAAAPDSGVALALRYLVRNERALERQHALVRELHELAELAWWFLYCEAGREGALPIDGLEYVAGQAQLPPGEVPFPVGPDRPDLVRVQALSEGYELKINPGEFPLLSTQAETQARVDWEISRGYTTDPAEMMRRDPDLSADDALRRWLANREFNERMKNAFAVGAALRALPATDAEMAGKG